MKRKTNKEQFKDLARQVSVLSNKYYALNGRHLDPEKCYTIVDTSWLILFGVCAAVAAIITAKLFYGWIPVWGLVVLSLLTAGITFGTLLLCGLLIVWFDNESCKPFKEVMFYFCTNRAIRKVQKEVDTLETEVRRCYDETVHDAQTFGPIFEALFKTLEEELGTPLSTTLNPDTGDLPEGAIIVFEAKVDGLPEFHNEWIDEMIDEHRRFRVNEEELLFWQSFAPILVSYKAHYEHLGNIVANAH